MVLIRCNGNKHVINFTKHTNYIHKYIKSWHLCLIEKVLKLCCSKIKKKKGSVTLGQQFFTEKIASLFFFVFFKLSLHMNVSHSNTEQWPPLEKMILTRFRYFLRWDPFSHLWLISIQWEELLLAQRHANF